MKTAPAPRRHALRVIAHVVAALQVLPPGASVAQASVTAVREPSARVVEREGQARRIAVRIEREQRAQAAAEAARISADANAPKNQRPIVGVAANGVPVVLIAAPAANGVSHNRYSEFNVGSAGLVLNNSGANAQTQIAGWVQGNPFLGNNSARIILNEVSGQLPTSLRGQIEVAGRAADVIIANPNGIACNGCGFINTPRATLTTGTPVYAQDGVLVGFAVQRGAVAFDGAGLDARNVDQLDILAHSVRANAEVWANQLNVVTGAHQTDYANGKVTAQSSGTTPAPVSLDVSQLGGMYANTVRLVGTQQGLGVNSQGTIAALAGDLEITQAGDIRLAGRTQASGAANIRGADVQNSGSLVAGGSLGITGTAVRNDGSAVSGDDLNVKAQNINGSGTFAAGIDANGSATQHGSLRMTASHAITLQGARLIAGSDVRATGSSVTARDGSVFGRNITLSGDRGLTLSGADISATDMVTLSTLATLNTDSATIEGPQLALQARSVSNRGGALTHSGNSSLTIGAADGIDNRDGTIAANATDLTLQGARLDNAGGAVRHAGNGTLRVDAQTVDNNGGSLLGNGAISLDAVTLTNRGGSISAQGALGITTTGTLDNTDGLIAGRDALTVTARGDLDNSGGAIRGASATAATRVQADGTLTNASRNGIAAEINANATLTLSAGTLINDNSRITTGQSLAVTTGAMSNTGSTARVLAETDVTLNVASLDNSAGAIIDARSGNATVTASGAVTNSGASSAIQSAAVTTITANGIANSGLVTGATTTADARTGVLRNEQGGRIGATNSLTVSGNGLVNDASLLRSGGALAANARAGTLANNNSGATGGIVAGTSVTLRGSAIDNQGGYVEAGSRLDADDAAIGLIDNRNGGVLYTRGDAVLTAGGLDNSGGTVEARGDLTLTTSGSTVSNASTAAQTSRIAAGRALTLRAASLDNRGAGATAANAQDVGLYGNTLNITLGDVLNNSGGYLRATDTLTLTAGNLDNSDGTVMTRSAAQGVGSADLTITGALANGGGLLYASELLGVKTATLAGAGNLSSLNRLSLTVNGDFTNDNAISANGNASVTATGTLTNNARIESAAELTVKGGNIVNAVGGEIVATDTRVDATNGTLTNRGLIDGSRVRVQATTIDNHGRIYGDEIAIGAATLNNHAADTANGVRAGAIAARWSLDIGVTTLNNQPGAELFSAGDLRIGGAFDTSGGQNGRAAGSATAVTNNGARIEALGNLGIASVAINNTNSNFATGLRTVLTDIVALNNVPGTSTWLADNQVLFRETGRGCDGHNIVANFSQMGDEDCFKLHVYTGNAAQRAIYGPTPREARIFVAEYQFPNCTGLGESESCDGTFTTVPDQFVFSNMDPLWAAAGVSAPTAASSTSEWRAAYIELQTRIDAYNALWQIHREWTHVDGIRTVQETTVISSRPGEILAGGQLNLTGAVRNDRSRIVAGGLLDATGASVNNIGADGERITTIDGRAARTTIESHTTQPDDRQYSRRDYNEINRQELTDVGLTPHQGFTAPGIDGTNAAAIKALPAGPAAARAAAAVITAITRGTTVAATTTTRLAVTPADGPGTISTYLPAPTLPTSSLFNVSNAPGRNYLVETDPRFTNQRIWASSDVLLAQLSAEPQTTLRRLGDGYYEQRLVSEQIMAATGQRYLGGYGNSEEQYLALLNAGAEFAQSHQLTVGTALTEAQMRLLTTDMVWLVAQNVTLPGVNGQGTVERVLAPQLYVRVAEGDLRADGTLMAGSTVRMQLQGDLTNSGAIYGRQFTDIRAENIGNTGRIASGDLTLLTARQDITSSGAIDGARIGLDAGRDVNLTTQTSTSSGKNTSRTSVDRVASINASQLLVVTSGRDITLTGAQVTSGGALVLDAKRDLNLQTVNVAESINIAWDAKNRLATASTAEIGSSVRAAGDITLAAGQDLNARAAYVATDSNGTGAITATAGRDIVITNGVATSSFEEDRYVEKKSSGIGPSGSMLSRRTSSARSTTEHSAGSAEQVQGSTFSAERISMSSGRDLTVQGSSVVATNDVSLDAKRDLTITSAEQSSSTEQSKDEQRSGAGAMGGISNGKKRVEQANTSTSTTQVGSSIGSLQGNVSLSAGNDYRQTASDVRALGLRDKDGNLLQGGDIAISGANVTIDTADNTSQATQDLRMRQSGVSLTFSSPMLNTLQGIVATAEAGGQSGDKRTQALAAASTVMAVANLAQTLTQTSALNISLSVGNSKNESHSEQSGSMAATSSVEAGGNLTIKATGKQPGQGNITATGANLSAGNNASLDATNDIELRAAQNSATQSSTSKSSSASVGIGFALGGTQNGFTINAAASQARGNANGADTTNTLATISAGNGLTLNSGRDTTLIGATASGNQVTANVGGSLDIQSVQDTSTFASKEQSAGVGVSLCIPPICYGASSGSASFSNAKVNGEFASVTTQSGLKAGDSGFTVNVNGNTNLVGAAITSSQTAVDQNKNSFSTDTVTQSEIKNKDSHDASSLSASASYSTKIGDQSAQTLNRDGRSEADKKAAKAPAGGMSPGVGVGQSSADERSTTGNAISGATITVKSGDTKALEGIDRTATTEASSANALTKQWDGQQLASDVKLQAQLVQSVGSSAARLIGDYAGNRFNELTARAEAATEAKDPVLAQQLSDEAAKWAEGGLYRVGLHTGVGLLTGGVDGALGAGAVATAAPLIDRLQGSVQDQLQQAGMSPDAAKVVAAVIGTGTATAVGAAAGGNASAAAVAFNIDANNRQLHPSEVRRIRDLARGDPNAEARLTIAGCALVHCSAEFAPGSAEYMYWRAIEDKGNTAEFSAERALLNQQQQPVATQFGVVSQPMFGYGSVAAGVDGIKRVDNTYQVSTRLGGGVQALGGAATAVAGAGMTATGALSCPATVAGCALAAGGVVVTFSGIDNTIAGVSTAVNGQAQPTLGAQALSATLGISPQAAELIYGAVGLAPAAFEAVVVTRATNAAAESSAVARASYGPAAAGGAEANAASTQRAGSPEVLELFGGRTPQVPGARNVDPADPNAIARDARNMPNVATGSQDRVVVSNPYIPASESGTRSMMDYLPEAARVTRPGGEIVISSQWSNAYGVRTLPSTQQLADMGLEIVYQGPLAAEFRGMTFVQTSGTTIPIDSMRTVVLRRCDGPCRP